MTPDELKAIKTRCEKATPLPWELDNYNEAIIAKNAPSDQEGFTVNDMKFIAHARTDIPKLLDEIERWEKAHASLILKAGELGNKLAKAKVALEETIEKFDNDIESYVRQAIKEIWGE